MAKAGYTLQAAVWQLQSDFRSSEIPSKRQRRQPQFALIDLVDFLKPGSAMEA